MIVKQQRDDNASLRPQSSRRGKAKAKARRSDRICYLFSVIYERGETMIAVFTLYSVLYSLQWIANTPPAHVLQYTRPERPAGRCVQSLRSSAHKRD